MSREGKNIFLFKARCKKNTMMPLEKSQRVNSDFYLFLNLSGELLGKRRGPFLGRSVPVSIPDELIAIWDRPLPNCNPSSRIKAGLR